MKIVFDTGVLVSAFLLPGSAEEHAYRMAIEGHLELITSPRLLMGLGKVLTQLSDRTDLVPEAVLQVASMASVVRPGPSTPASGDPAMDAAVEGGAEAVVSTDLRALPARRGLRALRPEVLVEELSRAGSGDATPA